MRRGGLLIVLLLLGIAAASLWPTGDLQLRLLFDNVKGLKSGDAVYLDGLQVGEVRELTFAGRRVAVDISIKETYADAVPADSYFFLWQDELNPERRAIRLQPGTSPITMREGGPTSISVP